MIAALAKWAGPWFKRGRKRDAANDHGHEAPRGRKPSAVVSSALAPATADCRTASESSEASALSLWVLNTRVLAGNGRAGSDGRLRLRGPQSLDICASQPLVTGAIAAFTGWVESLTAAGVEVEIRHVDGWRVCAVVDGLPLAIRIRERMRRIATLGPANLLLEQWLGGKVQEKFEPGGALELQVMRHGVCAAAIPFHPAHADDCFQVSLGILCDLSARETRYQRKLRAEVEARRVSIPAPAQPVQDKLGSRRFSTPPSAFPSTEDSASTPTEGAEVLESLLNQLESLLQRMNPGAREEIGMGVSLGNLASACRMPNVNKPEPALIRLANGMKPAGSRGTRTASAGRKRGAA